MTCGSWSRPERGGRVVLCGHSWGGPIIRVAASSMDPELLAGLVLVDPSDEGARLYDSHGWVLSERLTALLMPVLARTGGCCGSASPR